VAAKLKQPKVLRILDEYSKQTLSPNFLQQSEKKQPNWAESHGMLMTDTAKWTVEFIQENITNHHDLAVFAASWKLEALKRMSKEELAALNKVPVVDNKKDQPVQRRAAGIVHAA
jgi:hypothetical protein